MTFTSADFQTSATERDAIYAHSQGLDERIGYQLYAIEAALLERAKALNPHGDHHTWGHGLHQGHQTWVGLYPQTLNTPYSELLQLCEQLALFPGSRVVDLGAGYGRLGLVLHFCFPEVSFLGLEYVEERVLEGKRIFESYQCRNAVLKVQDLTASDFELPEADFYFLYDYGTVPALRKTLYQLEAMSEKRKFKLVARGKGIRSLIHLENPWLSGIYPVHHEEHYSIYSTF